MSALTKALMRFNKAQLKFVPNYKRAASNCQQPKSEMNPKYSKRMIKFKKLQEKFQRDDGNPIFLKMGALDRILYLSTLGLCVVGLVLDCKYYASYMYD